MRFASSLGLLTAVLYPRYPGQLCVRACAVCGGAGGAGCACAHSHRGRFHCHDDVVPRSGWRRSDPLLPRSVVDARRRGHRGIPHDRHLAHRPQRTRRHLLRPRDWRERRRRRTAVERTHRGRGRSLPATARGARHARGLSAGAVRRAHLVAANRWLPGNGIRAASGLRARPGGVCAADGRQHVVQRHGGGRHVLRQRGGGERQRRRTAEQRSPRHHRLCRSGRTDRPDLQRQWQHRDVLVGNAW